MLGAVATVPKKIDSCTQSDVELCIKELWVVSSAKPQLPLLVEDAARPVNEAEQVGEPVDCMAP